MKQGWRLLWPHRGGRTKLQDRRGRYVWLGCGLAVLLASCNSGGTDPGSGPAREQPVESVFKQQPADAQAPKPIQPAYTAPLTGAAMDAPNTSRPFMVVVNNAPQARPQSGLSQADIVYEVLAEGEITRLIGLFQSSSFEGPVGPVRSIRPYFISIGQGYKAIHVHAGGSPDGYSLLADERLAHLDEITNAGALFWRDKARKAPHNLYTSLSQLKEGAAKRGLSQEVAADPVYTFVQKDSDAQEAMSAQQVEATKLEVTFLVQSYRVSYTYEDATHLYKRAINEQPHVDLNTGEALSAANVVVLGTKHRVLDREGRRDVTLIGSGPAVLFQRGKARTVEWSRQHEDDPVRLYEQGREAALQPGQTHVLIVPDQPSFDSHLSYGVK
ncbi:DUF3048 domain-containing protein [Paenibacillus sp. YYML68]|uniref:DUF3048 domain-containing protein n=1 Tax=Paenibacillus sp. YYML68 TaxID=2909250 RepID=UPI00248F7FD1|nr:DUF3048 domain-containing protein [Paenibacillus sp. YYML68]